MEIHRDGFSNIKSSLFILVTMAMLTSPISGGRSSGAGYVRSEVNHLTDNVPTWPGHMEPLGAKAIKRAIPVLEEFPSPETFYIDYILGSLPVVFRNGARKSPAFKLWTDQALGLRPESESTMVDVEMRKKEDREQPMMRMSFSEFLSRYQEEDEYVVTTLPEYLRKDILLPPPLVCDDVIKRINDAVMWFSSGGTKSVLHNDDNDNINCLFSGQKEILFLNYTQYRHQVPLDHPEGSYSSIDVESVDMDKHPGMRDVEFYHAKMYAGDCIYIPYKWMHQVNSFGRNMAVNVWWEHSCEKRPSPEICGDTSRKLTLADIKLQVEYPPGHDEAMRIEDTTPADHLDQFISELTKNEDASFNLQQFADLFQKKLAFLDELVWTEECETLAKEAFELLDKKKDNLLTKEDWIDLKNELAHNREEMYHFQLESKLLMLWDIKHEQVAQKRLEAYEAEKRSGVPEDIKVDVHVVDPPKAEDIDWDELVKHLKGNNQAKPASGSGQEHTTKQKEEL